MATVERPTSHLLQKSEHRVRFDNWQKERQKREGRRREIIPPLTVENDHGDPSISVYSGAVDGVDRVVTIMHNRRSGRALDSNLSPSDSPLSPKS